MFSIKFQILTFIRFFEDSVVSLNFRDELQANWGTAFPEWVASAIQEAIPGTTRVHGLSKHDQ
jgi:hypothetical protein